MLLFPAAAVYLDGKRLQMALDENEQEHILGLESGEMMLLWQLHRPDAGHAVEITTGVRQFKFKVKLTGSIPRTAEQQAAYL